MSWKIAIVVALLTALVTAVVTAPVADHVTKQMKVSNMEGGRGYLVVLLILAALVGGVVIGLVVTRVVGAVEWGQFWKAQGYALLVSNALVFGIAGLCLLSVPRQLLMDGEQVALDFEVFVPLDLGPSGPPSEKNLRMSLYANTDDNRYVELDTKRIRTVGGEPVIPGEAALNTASMGRMLSLTINDTVGYTLDMPLAYKPTVKDLAWTERMPMRLSKLTEAKYEYTRVMVRYRVVKRGTSVD
jgi:hypothetical protein